MKSITKFTLFSLLAISSILHAFEYGFAERQGYRETMEDAHVIQENGSYSVYAIFDGHGGKAAATTAATSLVLKVILDALPTTLNDMATWIKTVEDDLKRYEIISGTTMVTVIIDKKTKEAHLFWVGDSRAIVIRDGKIIEATVDHNLTTEAYRLKQANANIQGKYIKNPASGKGLAVPRTIGDLAFKKNVPAIIADPAMKRVQLQSGDYVILACDGLWDALSNEEVAEYIAANPKLTPIDDASLKIRKSGAIATDPASSEGVLKTLAQSLRDKAMSTFKTRDNISVIIIRI